MSANNEERNLRSHLLTATIRQKMTEGEVSFAEYMREVLYHPSLGYYNAPDFSIGEQGDFITAPHISPLFAKCFAYQCSQILPFLNQPSILEIGAGMGKFAFDLLTSLDKMQSLPDKYFIYEISPTLRTRQKAILQTLPSHLYTKVIWLDDFPQSFVGVVIANEVLDALPVHLFRIGNQLIEEVFVEYKDDKFVPVFKTATTALSHCVERIKEKYNLTNPYSSEVNLNAIEFIKRLAQSIHQGIVLFADYGYGENEYYHPARSQGTLTCFYQHQKHSNPYLLPGLQDITSHVNFTSVIDIAFDQGFDLTGFTTQAAFLLANKIEQFSQQSETTLTATLQHTNRQAIKKLIMPNEMGELIKVMALSKNIPAVLLQGFTLQDRRFDL